MSERSTSELRPAPAMSKTFSLLWNASLTPFCSLNDLINCECYCLNPLLSGARCSSVVRTFAHGAMGRRIDPSWGGPNELFLVPASAPRLVYQKAEVCAILSVGWRI